MENQSSTSSMQFLLLEQVQFLNVKDDSLLQWELVNVVDAEEDEEEEEEEIHDAFGSLDSLDSSISWSVSSPDSAPIEGIHHHLLHLDADVEDHHHHHSHDDDHGDLHDGYDEEQVNDGDDEDDGDDDLDDELVPWDVGNKLGRQRMRKLGKRAFSKMNNSKRSPYLFLRPGCVRGKHGLGLKHNC